MHVVPNGVDVRSIRPVDAAEKTRAKRELRAGTFTAVFVGSDYAPNREAARAIDTYLRGFSTLQTRNAFV